MAAPISSPLVGLPLGTAALTLAAFSWRRWDREKKAAEALGQATAVELPVGTLAIVDRASCSLATTEHSGRIMLVLVGDYGSNTAINLLDLLYRCGLDKAIGAILLIQLDARRRMRFMTHVPAVFHDRIVQVGAASLAGGLGNRSPEEAWALIEYWGPAVVNGTNDACERHQLVTPNDEPALVLTFISQGGQAIIGTLALGLIHERFPLAQLVGVTALPVDDLLRQEAEKVLDAYRAQGLEAIIVSDNLADGVRNDFGIVASIVGFLGAAEDADMPTEADNALRLMAKHAPGNLLSFSTRVINLPGFRFQLHPNIEPRYFVYSAAVTSSMLTALNRVPRPEYHALPEYRRNGRVPLTSTFDIVLAAIKPEDLKRNEDEVILARQLAGTNRRNNHLLFAPVTTKIDPQRPQCPIAVVSLHALADGPDLLRELLTPEELPVAFSPAPPPPGNGHPVLTPDALAAEVRDAH